MPHRGTDLNIGVRNAVHVPSRTKITRRPRLGSLAREAILKFLVGLLVVIGTAGLASAESPTKVFPLTGHRMPKPLTKAPETLTRALAKSAGGEVTSNRIEDLADCDLDTDPCLESVMAAVHARRIVYGSIVNRAEGGVIVRLTWFDGTAREQKLVLTGDTPEDLADQLVYGLTEGAMKNKDQQPKLKVPKAIAKHTPRTPDPETPEAELPPGIEKVETTNNKDDYNGTLTIGLIGGGAAVTLIGVGFLVSANSLKGEVERAPTDTYSDLAYLASLERAGKLRTEIGAGLMIGGVAAGAVGVWRMM